MEQSRDCVLVPSQTLEQSCEGRGRRRGFFSTLWPGRLLPHALLAGSLPPLCLLSLPIPSHPFPSLLPLLRPALSSYPAQCPENMVFRSAEQCRQEGGPCPRLCLTHGPGIECSGFCAPGCTCPPGLFLHNASCLPRSQCPCQLHGQLYAPGAMARLDSCNNWWVIASGQGGRGAGDLGVGRRGLPPTNTPRGGVLRSPNTTQQPRVPGRVLGILERVVIPI